MKRTMSVIAASLIATWAGVAAQSGGSMSQGGKMEGKMEGKMDAMARMDVTYMGCLEATESGTYRLTHAVAEGDGMAGHSMKQEEPMKKDGMAGEMKKSETMSDSLALTSEAVNLSKHVGRRVSVTGSPARKMDMMAKDGMAKDGMAKGSPAFSVKSMTVIARSCS